MILKEIGALLQSNNLGTLETDLFLGYMLDDPDECIALFSYAGEAPDLHWNGEYPGLQVRVRGKKFDYDGPWNKIKSVEGILHGLCEQVLKVTPESTGTRYLLIKAQGSPELLKRDQYGRVEFVQHFSVMKER